MSRVSRVSRFFQHMSKVFESWVLTPTSRRLLSVEGFSTDVKCVKGCPTICSNLCSAILLWFFLPPLPSASHFDVIFFLQKSSYGFFLKGLKKRLRLKAPRSTHGRGAGRTVERRKKKYGEGSPTPHPPMGGVGQRSWPHRKAGC